MNIIIYIGNEINAAYIPRNFDIVLYCVNIDLFT